MPCPYCGAALSDGARLCTTCGRLIAPRQPDRPEGSAPAAPAPAYPGQMPPTGQGPVYQPGSSYAADPYGPFFDPASLPPETADAWRQHRFHATFSVLLLLLVHFLTFGMASPFLVARKLTFLPVVKPNDFSTAKGVGFLFIPFFAFYWVFVLCRRIVDRLTLQARLWGLPGAPSRGMATAIAIGWVLSAIPYVGLLLWFPVHVALWPVYLAQIQRFCNRLALEAAPPEARPSMLELERATRLRWLGWIVVVPCLMMAASGLVAAVVVATGPILEAVVGTAIVLLVAGCGGVLIYLGERRTHGHRAHLEDQAPWILAGYLRIDKNAAWTMAWIGGAFAILFVVAGLTPVTSPTPAGPQRDAVTSIVLGAMVGAGAAYALLRAVLLRREIERLIEMEASPRSDTTSW